QVDAVLTEKLGRPEPRGEAMAIHLRFHLGEHFVPGVHWPSLRWDHDGKRHILKGLRAWAGTARVVLAHKPFLHKDFNTCGKAMKRLYKKPSQNANPSYHSAPRTDKEDR